MCSSMSPKTPHRMKGICPNVPLAELSKTQHRYYPSGMLLSLKNHFQHVQLVGNWNVDEKNFKVLSVHGIHEIHSIYIVASRGYIIYSDRLVTSCTEMEVNLMDSNTPLNVELRTFIESHFKFIFMNVKLIFRPGFSVNLQNLPGPPWGHVTRTWPAVFCYFSDETMPPN